jgi:hypothetical protein
MGMGWNTEPSWKLGVGQGAKLSVKKPGKVRKAEKQG